MSVPTPSQGALTFLLGQAYKRASASLQTLLASHDLTIEQWRILGALQAREGVTVSALADEVAMKIPALSKNVDRMVSRALLQRQRDFEDSRKVLVSITDFGVELLEQLSSDVAECDRELARELGLWEAERLEKMLQAFVQR